MSTDNSLTLKVTKIKHDSNGNPRYIVHYRDLGLKHYVHTSATKAVGLRMYTSRTYCGMYVFSCYGLPSTLKNWHNHELALAFSVIEEG